MGPSTEKALRDFRQAQGLPASGDLDARTLSALGVEHGGSMQEQSATHPGSTQNQAPSSQGSMQNRDLMRDQGTTQGKQSSAYSK